jgi:pyridinium-3,5-bisthiocarboxylic acid mononucleotide nickel chelatase
MKIAYFDCIAGASGDMLLGALVDAGLPLETLQERLELLNLGDEFELTAHKLSKNGFSATKVNIEIWENPRSQEHPHGRHLAQITSTIRKSRLPENIQEKAIGMFRRLAEVEAGIHGLPIDQVHLHEVGGVDAIVDVVGFLMGLDALCVEKVVASPLPLGRGFV